MGKRELRKVDNSKTGKKPTKFRTIHVGELQDVLGFCSVKTLHRKAYCSNENQEDQMAAAIQCIASRS